VNLPPSRNRWPDKYLQLWAERAALMEYDGKLQRLIAEAKAEADIRKVAAQEER
jgi:hypothetical protein